MNECEHTPGPWHTAGERGEFINSEGQMNVCRVNNTVSWKEAMQGPSANAALVARAVEVPHDGDPACPGVRNKKRLEGLDLLDVIADTGDLMAQRDALLDVARRADSTLSDIVEAILAGGSIYALDVSPVRSALSQVIAACEPEGGQP